MLIIPVNFINNSSYAKTYSWNFGDGKTSTLRNPNHAFANPGTYSVILSAYAPFGCVNTDTAIIKIIPVNPFTIQSDSDCPL